MRRELRPIHKSRQIEYRSLGATTIDDLIFELNDTHNYLHLLHYGGHSDSQFLELRDKPLQAEKVAKLLGMAENLRLLFLNGCANKDQVKYLQENGVKSIIATSVVINDVTAVKFSSAFYNALRGGKNIEQAFETAVIAFNEDFPEVEVKLYRSSNWDGEEVDEKYLPWGLYPLDEDSLMWVVPKRPPAFSREDIDALKSALKEDVNESLDNSSEYQQLKEQLAELDPKLAKAKSRLDKYPDDPDFKQEYQQINDEREAIAEKVQALRQSFLGAAAEFTKVPILTERLERAQEYLAAGDYMAARAVLNPEQMLRDFDQLTHMKKKGEGDLEQVEEQLVNNANEFSVLAYLTSNDHSQADRLNKAAYYFQKAITASRGNEEPEFTAEKIMSYAYFLEDHNQEDDALPLFEEAADMIRPLAQEDPERYEPGLAQILNDLGTLHYKLRSFEEAGKAYSNSLEISRHLAETDPGQYEPVVATTLLNLAMVHEDTGDVDQARQTYAKGLEVFEQLAKENPTEYEDNYAHALNNIGILHLNQGDVEQAIESLQASYDIRYRLANEQSEAYLPAAADTLGNLGLAYLNKGDAEGAEKNLRAALDVLQPLAEQDPERFEPDFATQLSNLGLLYRNMGQLEPAEHKLAKALEIYQRLHPENPARYAPDLVNALTNYGELKLQEGDLNTAGPVLESALLQSRELVEAHPAAYGYNHIRILVLSLYYLGTLQEESDGENYTEPAHKLIAECKQTLGLFDQNEPAIQEQQEQLQQYLDYFGSSG